MEGNVHWTGLFMIDKYGVLVLHQRRYFIWNCCCDTNMVKFFTLMFAMHDDKIDLVIFVMG